MINRIEFLKQFNFFKLEKNVDIDKLETLICLELLLSLYYHILEDSIHNNTIRKKCQNFKQNAQYHQEALKRVFSISPKNETSIKNKVNRYLLQHEPTYLPLKAVINLAINLSAFKMGIYRNLARMTHEYHGLLNNFIEDNLEEINFLRKEKEFHQMDLLRIFVA